MDTSIVQLVSVVVMTMSFLLLGNVCCQQAPTAGKGTYERVMVQSNSTNDIPTPDNLRVTFRVDSSDVVLSLKRNPNIPPDAIIVIGEKGNLIRSKTNSSEAFAHYIDPSSDASVLVKAERDTDGRLSHRYTGVFKVGNDTYAIEPEPSTEARRKRRRRRGLLRMTREVPVINDPHLVRKELPQLDATGPSLKLPNELLKSPTSERRDPSTDVIDGNSVVKPSEKPTYVVEIMVVVDHRIYEKMYGLSTESDKKKDTVNRITQYYGHIINGVDLRFRGINDSSYAVNVRFAGIYIATDANSSKFIENNRMGSESSAYVAAQRAIYDFADWVNANKGSLPSFDQASLFTSEYLNGASEDRISGLAFYRSICSYYSVLIIRDSGEYGSSQTSAHELGHNLGAGHDGVDNTCSASEQHIMVASSGPLTDEVYKNAYTFSTCSISEMRSFLSTLLPNNCLAKLSGNSTVDTGPNIPLGKLYRPDEQCAMMYGNGSFYCSGQNADQQICRTMACYHPVWQYCVAPYEQRAFSGTQCGNQKWCFMGDCVIDRKADALYGSEDCIYGDNKAPFYDGFRCSDVRSQPWNCYRAAVADSCCQSCTAIKNDNLLGCEYGDRYPGCKNYRPLNCDDPTFKNGCCKTCMEQKGDCEFGDRISGCTAADCRDELKHYNCCRTCASYSAQISLSMPATSTSTATTPTTTTTRTTSTSTTKTTSTPSTTKTTQTTTTTTTATSRPTTTTTTMKATSSVADIPKLDPSCVDTDATWCRSAKNFLPSNCYTTNIIYCCAFCFSIRDTSRPDCEYGDHYSWCSRSRCSTDDERKICCGTCKNFLTTSTTTSTTTTTTRPSTIPTTTSTTSTTPTTAITTTRTSTPAKTTTTPTSSTSTTTTTTSTPIITKLMIATSIRVIPSKSTPSFSRPPGNVITSTSMINPVQTSHAEEQNCYDASSMCSNIEPSQCYSPVTRTMCCKSCLRHAGGPPGCEYGDRYFSLCVRVNPNDCYMYLEDCCRTCQGN